MLAQRARAIGKACLRQLPAILGVLLLIGAIYVVQKEFRHLRLRDIEAALRDIPLRALAIGFLWTVLSYGVLTIYDRLGTIYAGHKVSYGRVAFASFCAYALSHNLGFAAVSGAAVRYRLYAHWGLTPLQIAKTVAFCSLTFALGGMVLGGTILFLEPQSIPFFGEHMPAAVMYAVGALLWAIVIAYVTLSRVFGSVRLFGHEIGLPGWRMAIVQVVLATVDVAITASIFYALLPTAPHLTWPIFLGVYVASYTAGLAANLPGGIGVFDTAILLGLEPYVERAAHRRRDRGVPAVLLRHSAVPRRLPVHRQRDPAARQRAAAPGRAVCGRAGALERARLRRRQRHRTGRAVRRDAAVRRRPGAAAGLLLDRSGFRRDGQSGRPVHPVADRRRADRGRDSGCRSGSTWPGGRRSSCWWSAPPSPRRRWSGCGSPACWWWSSCWWRRCDAASTAMPAC